MVSRLIAEMVDQHVIARQGKHYILLDAFTAVSGKTRSLVCERHPCQKQSFSELRRTLGQHCTWLKLNHIEAGPWNWQDASFLVKMSLRTQMPAVEHQSTFSS